MKQFISNKKANLNYEIIDKFIAGISLKGTEVKSLSKAEASINEAFIIIKNNEAFIINMYIAPFKEGNIHNVDSYRNRKLLLNKNEIIKLKQKSQQLRLAIIPLSVIGKNNKLKLIIALAKSKNKSDKREAIKSRDDARQMKNHY